MTNRREEAIDILCDAIMSLPRKVIMEKLMSMITLKSDIRSIEEDEENRQELVKSFINSNLHVN
jgi:threonine synthase